ncbi:MAG: hypothetical protein ACE360_08885 [Hyphomicrobiales bacterium]
MAERPIAKQDKGDHAAAMAFLSDRQSYPHRPAQVEVIETHTSHVFVAGDLVYKTKKPIQLSFVDYGPLEARRQSCEREISLNRALAPGVYLKSLPVLRLSDGSLAFDGNGVPVEWVVLMRRLDTRRLLDRCCQTQSVRPDDIERLCDRLAEFYRTAPRSCLTGADLIATYQRNIALATNALSDPLFGLPSGLVQPALDALRQFMHDCPNLLTDRLAQGRIVDGHGDLRPEHVYLGPPALVIDRLEFDDRLRQVDPFDEIALLSMECERLRCPWIGDQLHADLEKRLDDDVPPQLKAFYRTVRACMRARLSIEHLRDAKPRHPERWPARARDYLRLANPS